MDGNSDYSQLSRAQLEEALGRIDKTKYPINYHRILAELDQRLSESPQLRPPPSRAALIARYSFFLAVGYLCFLFLSILGVTRPPIIAYTVVIVGTLVLYLHLAWSHPVHFLPVAISVAITGSAMCSAIYSLSTAPKPIRVFVGALVLNFGMASLAGNLHRTKQLLPPANNRWRGP